MTTAETGDISEAVCIILGLQRFIGFALLDFLRLCTAREQPRKAHVAHAVQNLPTVSLRYWHNALTNIGSGVAGQMRLLLAETEQLTLEVRRLLHEYVVLLLLNRSDEMLGALGSRPFCCSVLAERSMRICAACS